jgi:hypothetical protein
MSAWLDRWLVEAVVLPVSNAGGRATVSIRPDLLDRYSIVLTHPLP